MKLSKRETFMFVALFFILLTAGYWFLILSPIQDEAKVKLLEYQTLEQTYNDNAAIIASVDGLQSALDALQDDITAIEVKLLPALEPEIIAEHFVTIFAENGLITTSIKCDKPVLEQFLEADGTYSPNSVQWMSVNLDLCGTDGVTPGGTTKIGYSEFISAVKTLEAENPDAIQVSAISMQETNQGFQYFKVSIRVSAFKLANRVSAVDTNEKYITWSRETVALGGILGIPYEAIPPLQLQPEMYRPFATVSLPEGAATADNTDSAVVTQETVPETTIVAPAA